MGRQCPDCGGLKRWNGVRCKACDTKLRHAERRTHPKRRKYHTEEERKAGHLKATKRYLQKNKAKWDAYARDYRAKHRKRLQERQREYRSHHPEKWKEWNRQWRKNNRERARLRRIKYVYGLTPEQLAAMGDRCHICNVELLEAHAVNRGDNVNKRAIDHCHATNIVRGLLCGRCNQGLGMFQDSPERLRAAAAYLDRAKTRKEVAS